MRVRVDELRQERASLALHDLAVAAGLPDVDDQSVLDGDINISSWKTAPSNSRTELKVSWPDIPTGRCQAHRYLPQHAGALAGLSDRCFALSCTYALAVVDDDLLRRLRDIADTERFPLLVKFAETLFRRIAPGPMSAEYLIDAFAFIDERGPDSIAVRVGQPPSASVEVNVDDRPFLLSSVIEELHALGYRAVRTTHPILSVERAENGRVRALDSPDGRREAYLHVEVDRPIDARAEVEAALHRSVGDVLLATADHGAMCAVVSEVAASGTKEAAFCEWLLDGNFLFLSCQRIDSHGRLLAQLGVEVALPSTPLRDPFIVSRAVDVSRVQRRARMHEVRMLGPHGEIRLLGLFTAKAAAEPAARTPVVRDTLTEVLRREGALPGSHDEAAVITLFQALPKDELLTGSVEEVGEMVSSLLTSAERAEVGVVVRPDSVVVFVPRHRWSSELSRRVEQALEDLAGARVDSDVALVGRVGAVGRYAVHSPLPDGVEEVVRRACRAWEDDVVEALVARRGDVEGHRLALDYATRLPASYHSATPPDRAAADMIDLDQMLSDGASMRVVLRAAEPLIRVKLFSAGAEVELSSVMPIIESLGLLAVEELPYVLLPPGPELRVHDFGVRHPSEAAVDITLDGPRIAAAFTACSSGVAEVDSLNRLVLLAGFIWEDVAVLRAYRRYRSLVGTRYSPQYMDDALADNPDVARRLMELFAARFDPTQSPSDEDIAALRREVLDGCDNVARLDQDRILRGMLALIDATVRTNHYVRGDRAPLALKIDSAAVPSSPHPVPWREVFVHSPAVEGVHLRNGPVARGGIRWSERFDDYRTEVLGLMKAQMLKNAVIVPTGAKGGFVVKVSAVDNAGARAEVERQYEAFVGALLEVTDNVVDGRVVAPLGVRKSDGDDPYLVVAADRGTASFSDLANAISAERGFWLGDAFASGGSHGYDHKALGITARGVWVAIERHFRELEIDARAEPITVAGIGDMSGDVFGNGMLHPNLKLVAAFDHRDLFLDPSPDASTSFAERQRLFCLPASSWQDYDRDRLSRGGGVWSRALKRIPISAEAADVLRIDPGYLTPAETIQAILRAPVDLLFAGGIGTFVKAEGDDDLAIGDRVNDELRVEASQIRARVVAEGANLCVTQRARVQYARRGGRINTDAIDNSSGVDISDHEVNLKILLRSSEERGEISGLERDQILADAADDVVAQVLHDTALQTWTLSREAATSADRLGAFETLMSHLESRGLVDRRADALPTSEELAEREVSGAGLTRPELAVVMAAAKRDLVADILASDLTDQPAMAAVLEAYFPPSVLERVGDSVADHRLRRELIAAVVANDAVDRVGVTFAFQMALETETERAAVAGAWWVARSVAGFDAQMLAIESLEGVEARHQLEFAAQLAELGATLTRSYLRRGDNADIAAAVARHRSVFSELEHVLPDLGSAAQRAARRSVAELMVDRGVEPATAATLAVARELMMLPDIADVRQTTGRPVVEVAEAFLHAGEVLGIERLHRRLEVMKPGDRWAESERLGLLEDLRRLRRAAVERAHSQSSGIPMPEAVDRLLADRRHHTDRARALLRQAEADPARLDATAVTVRALRGVVE